jgi:NhaA family Na+:H+ antiporter
VIQTLLDGIHMVETPLQRLEHGLDIPVAFLIVPLFAQANAGIPIRLAQMPVVVSNPITLGIIVGLVVGKLIGIAGFSLLAVRPGIGQMPEGTTAKHFVGVGILGGIGFTMSIFIAERGFKGQPEALIPAKTACCSPR